MKTFIAADLFCGAGGTSTGLAQACDAEGRKLRLVAVNHWSRAVETHAKNHPAAAHHCEDLTTLDPRKAVPGGKLDLLVASPECTHHSVARGGMPMSDQSRASAWCVLRWATTLRVERILIENVPEFVTWGPIGSNGRPLKSRKGETFRAFINGLESLGYTVGWKLLNAADHGGATTRRRLFVQAVKGRRKLAWPEPTHGREQTPGLFGKLKPWRAAREVIDWSLRGESIFERKRPLSENTLKRIEAGLRKFGGVNAEPFLVLLNGGGRQGEGGVKSVDEPMPVVTAGGNHHAICEPFLMSFNGKPDEDRRRHSLDNPLPTQHCSNRFGLVEPFVIHTTHQGADRVHATNDPLPTVTGANRGELAFIVPHRQFDGMQVDDVGEPIRTITATNGGCHALCEPFLVPYYRTGVPDSVNDPAPTITTHDRFGLVQPDGTKLDILFRMLQPHELAAAMGFPAGYEITGNRGEQVRQIGNAVEVNTARALSEAALKAGVA